MRFHYCDKEYCFYFSAFLILFVYTFPFLLLSSFLSTFLSCHYIAHHCFFHFSLYISFSFYVSPFLFPSLPFPLVIHKIRAYFGLYWCFLSKDSALCSFQIARLANFLHICSYIIFSLGGDLYEYVYKQLFTSCVHICCLIAKVHLSDHVSPKRHVVEKKITKDKPCSSWTDSPDKFVNFADTCRDLSRSQGVSPLLVPCEKNWDFDNNIHVNSTCCVVTVVKRRLWDHNFTNHIVIMVTRCIYTRLWCHI